MKQYQDLVRHVLAVGTRKENRTGIDTISTFNYNYEHDLRDGFPLLTTKKIAWKNIVIELLWFLSGSCRSGFLDRHGCGFWKPWYNKPNPVDEFACDNKGVSVNAAYGPAWRRFEYPSYYESDSGLSGQDGPCTGYNDQIAWVLRKLKDRPMSRDLVVSAWQPHIAQNPPTPKAYLAPCHCMFILNVQNDEQERGERPWEAKDNSYQDTQFLGVVWAKTKDEAHEKALARYGPQWESQPDGEAIDCLYVQEPAEWRVAEYYAQRGEPREPTKRLCLHLTQRSCDTALGIPFNIASYALLLSLFSRFSGIEPGVFGHTLVDAHIYTAKPDGSQAEYDHIPGLKEQLTREPRPLPKLVISDDIKSLEDVERLLHPSVTTDEIMSKFVLEGYDPHPPIHFRVAV
jgi:thymidylate synthase